MTKQPNYAAAYAGLADTYNLIAFYGFGPTMNTVGQDKASALKALQRLLAVISRIGSVNEQATVRE